MYKQTSSLPVFVFLFSILFLSVGYGFFIAPHLDISTDRFANLVIRAARLEEVGDTSAKAYLVNRLAARGMWLSERDAKDADAMMLEREKDVLAKLYIMNHIRTKHDQPKPAEKPDRAA